MRNVGLEEAQDGIKIAGRNINNLRYAEDTTLTAKSEGEIKSLLMKVKEESEKVGLKLNIQEAKIMASSPITSWQIDGETVETVADFIFLGSKITADGDCSSKIKKRSGESGHPCLVPDFRGNAFNFSPLRVVLAVGLTYIAFIMLRYVPSIPAFWRVLIMKGCLILSKTFSASIEIIIWFL